MNKKEQRAAKNILKEMERSIGDRDPQQTSVWAEAYNRLMIGIINRLDAAQRKISIPGKLKSAK